jgi:hypothetical protein
VRTSVDMIEHLKQIARFARQIAGILEELAHRKASLTHIQTSLTVSPPLILIFAMILPLRYEPVGRVVRGQASSDVRRALVIFHKDQRPLVQPTVNRCLVIERLMSGENK